MFLNEVKTRFLGQRTYTKGDLFFTVVYPSVNIKVEDGFQLNGIPDDRADILYQWLYYTHTYSRERSDHIVRDAQLSLGKSKFMAGVSFYWRRMFGWNNWEEMHIENKRYGRSDHF